MSNNCETGSGGASITPSARPSIHSTCRNCPLTSIEGMARYGLKNKESKQKETQSQANTSTEGRDVVDNVQSKFLHTSSPVNARRNVKRNSVELTNSPCTNYSDDDCVLAKSVPSYLPSYSLYRDEFIWPHSYTNESANSTSSQFCNERSYRQNESNYESIHGTPIRHQQPSEIQTPSQQSPVVLLGVLVSVIAVIGASYYGYVPDEIGKVLPDIFPATTTNFYNSAKFHNDMNSLGQKYKIADNSILKIQTGISTILERQDTGSFVFVYKSNQINFDSEEFDSFMNSIATTAAKYLRNDSTQVRHIVVDGSKLEMRVHSELINKYRDEVTKTGVMLVRELDEVPSSLAMAFHYYCDEYNPLVKKSAIFFTLDMTKCSLNPVEQKPTHAMIEKCLQKKWAGVPEDNIRPLLNRVVSTVVDIGGD